MHIAVVPIEDHLVHCEAECSFSVTMARQQPNYIWEDPIKDTDLESSISSRFDESEDHRKSSLLRTVSYEEVPEVGLVVSKMTAEVGIAWFHFSSPPGCRTTANGTQLMISKSAVCG